MNAAGGLTEDFHPPRDGFIQTRARQVLSEAVGLLDAIVHDSDAEGDPAPRGHRRRDLRAHEAARSRG